MSPFMFATLGGLISCSATAFGSLLAILNYSSFLPMLNAWEIP